MGSCSEMMKSSSLQMTVSTDFLFFAAAFKTNWMRTKKRYFVASDEVVLRATEMEEGIEGRKGSLVGFPENF